MTRSQIHDRFVAEFNEESSPVQVTSAEIEVMERDLATVSPQSYLSFIQLHGCVRTPSLLNLVVDTQAGLPPIADFIAPSQAVSDTKLYWSGGMPKELVGFAGDGMGNLFCFRRQAVGTPRPDDAPVWLFDHEFCDDLRQLAASFDDWLFSYLKLKRSELTR